jgi:hypothetical protein
MLVCVLRGFTSQLAIWRLLSLEQLWFYPRFEVTDQAVYNRLARDGTEDLERLFEQISIVLAERLAPYEQKKLAPFASGVVVIDETTLDPVAACCPHCAQYPKEINVCCQVNWPVSLIFAFSNGGRYCMFTTPTEMRRLWREHSCPVLSLER